MPLPSLAPRTQLSALRRSDAPPETPGPAPKQPENDRFAAKLDAALGGRPAPDRLEQSGVGKKTDEKPDAQPDATAQAPIETTSGAPSLPFMPALMAEAGGAPVLSEKDKAPAEIPQPVPTSALDAATPIHAAAKPSPIAPIPEASAVTSTDNASIGGVAAIATTGLPREKERADTSDAGVPASQPTDAQPKASATPVTTASVMTALQPPLAPPPPPSAPQPATVSLQRLAQPVAIADVPVAIAEQAAGGERRFDIRLDPANLGRIEVTLDIAADGGVRTHITVERAETLHMLRNDAPKLDQALSAAGVAADPSGIEFSLRSDTGNQRQPQRGEEPPQPARPAPDEPALPTPPVWQRIATAATALDLTL